MLVGLEAPGVDRRQVCNHPHGREPAKIPTHPRFGNHRRASGDYVALTVQLSAPSG
jgi:hypothetical protein